VETTFLLMGCMKGYAQRADEGSEVGWCCEEKRDGIVVPEGTNDGREEVVK
jgi:hypothetical protein